jgi:MYXO-CTERM domain-containing protein
MSTTLRPFKAACAAVLLACASLSAQAAAVYNFDGLVDSGPLLGSAYTGSFSFEEPAPSFDGTVALTSFQLNFFGQSYTLADADDFTVPAALFYQGQFVGIDFIDIDAADVALRPFVQLTGGFTELKEAYFAYTAVDGAGFGNFTPVQQQAQVAEPASLGLALAGLGGLLAWRRRSAH